MRYFNIAEVNINKLPFAVVAYDGDSNGFAESIAKACLEELELKHVEVSCVDYPLVKEIDKRPTLLGGVQIHLKYEAENGESGTTYLYVTETYLYEGGF